MTPQFAAHEIRGVASDHRAIKIILPVSLIPSTFQLAFFATLGGLFTELGLHVSGSSGSVGDGPPPQRLAPPPTLRKVELCFLLLRSWAEQVPMFAKAFLEDYAPLLEPGTSLDKLGSHLKTALVKEAVRHKYIEYPSLARSIIEGMHLSVSAEIPASIAHEAEGVNLQISFDDFSHYFAKNVWAQLDSSQDQHEDLAGRLAEIENQLTPDELEAPEAARQLFLTPIRPFADATGLLATGIADVKVTLISLVAALAATCAHESCGHSRRPYALVLTDRWVYDALVHLPVEARDGFAGHLWPDRHSSSIGAGAYPRFLTPLSPSTMSVPADQRGQVVGALADMIRKLNSDVFPTSMVANSESTEGIVILLQKGFTGIQDRIADELRFIT